MNGHYSVEVKDGVARAFGAEGIEIDHWDLLALIEALDARYLLVKADINREVVGELTKVSEWVFPTRRRDLYKSGPCVYFMRRASQPGVMGIAGTINLAARTKGLSYELREKVEVVAYAKTPRYDEFVEFLRDHFFKFRSPHEGWFAVGPVMEFLKGVRS